MNKILIKKIQNEKINFKIIAILTWNTKIGTTRNVYANAEFKDVRLCLALICGVLNKTAANTIAYRTATKDKDKSAQRGANTTSQLHVIKPSNLNAKKINCKIFTAQNNSSSNDRSCLAAHIHTYRNKNIKIFCKINLYHSAI